MITEANAFHPTTKAAVAKALAELGVELSTSREKKTPLADLIKMSRKSKATASAPRPRTTDGTQRYHLVLPKGVGAPLAHVEPEQEVAGP